MAVCCRESALQGIARQQALSIAGITALDQPQQVKDSMDAAIKNGGSFNGWKKRVTESGVLVLPKHRLDNIYRTNLQGSYMAGKWEQFSRNADNRPCLMYDAVNDSRVRPAHLALDGIIRRIGDPFWKTHSPPNGYRCRCSLISLTEAQAQTRSNGDQGLNKRPALPDGTPAQTDKGWDYNPSDRFEGIRRAMQGKEGMVGDMLLSTLSNKLGEKMHIVKLAGFYAVQQQLTQLAKNNPALFNNDIPLIHAVSNGNFFAATDGKAIYFSISDELEKGFNPALELAAAFRLLSDNKKLTFNQEYSIEILQHELWHLVTHKTNMPTKNKGIIAETLVQLLARNTYHQIIESFGAKALHQHEIITGGFGYSVQVANMLALIDMLGIGRYDFTQGLKKAMGSNASGDGMVEDVKRFIALAANRHLSQERISELLKLLRHEKGFKQIADNKLNY